MMWQEDEEGNHYVDNGYIVDVIFRLQGKTLPVNYHFPLHQALVQLSPWLADENIGVHLIIAGEEGNGWLREDDPQGILYISRRTRLMLRINRAQLPLIDELVNKVLKLGEHELVLQSYATQALSQITTMYAHHVASDVESEEDFMQQVLSELKASDIRCKKMLCGKTRSLDKQNSQVQTRSLMLADLSVEDAIKLQQQGVGPLRNLGCGIFVPHKSLK